MGQRFVVRAGLRSGMEYGHALDCPGFIQTANDAPFLVIAGITLGRHDDRDRRLVAPGEFGAGQVALRGGKQQRQKVRLEP